MLCERRGGMRLSTVDAKSCGSALSNPSRASVIPSPASLFSKALTELWGGFRKVQNDPSFVQVVV